MDVLKFNEESLNKLKYIHLQKLAHKHNIKKRWAKKEELVHSLLLFKETLSKSLESCDNKQNEVTEWLDGASFLGIKPIENHIEEESDTNRATFTIQKFDDSRATYDLTNAINAILPELDQSVNNRLTFDIPRTQGINSPAHPILPKMPKMTSKADSQVKMLTIPYSPVSFRSTNAKKSIHQISSKSIAIKKAKVGASPLKVAGRGKVIRPVVTPTTNANRLNGKFLKNSVKELRPQEPMPAKKPVVTPIVKLDKNTSVVLPERRSSVRRKSKSDDPAARRSSNQQPANKFLTPPGKGQFASDSKKTKFNGKITGSKLPDFAKIHARQFEKMDSLDEYINKKSERVKKLFGTPLLKKPGGTVIKLHVGNLADVKEEKVFRKNIQSKSTPLKEKNLIVRSVINRNPTLRTQTDVKDKNRSHIHGIRTNKRFELQMKFRNL